MQISQLVKNMLKYVPVLAALVAMVIGVLIAQDLDLTSLESQTITPTQTLTEPNYPQPLIIPGADGPCGFSNIYTSLPPKCKTFDGKFIPVPGWDILVPFGGH